MRIERYRASKHQNMFEDWLIARELPLQLAKELPKIGFVGFDEELGAAAVFLRKIEGGFAFIDSVISNPFASSAQRHLALEGCYSACLEEAKRLKLSELFGYTVDISTLERALRYGFEKLPHAVMSLKL